MTNINEIDSKCDSISLILSASWEDFWLLTREASRSILAAKQRALVADANALGYNTSVLRESFMYQWQYWAEDWGKRESERP